MRTQPDQYSVPGVAVEDWMSMVHLVWHETPVLAASPLRNSKGSLARYGYAVRGICSGLQPPS